CTGQDRTRTPRHPRLARTAAWHWLWWGLQPRTVAHGSAPGGRPTDGRGRGELREPGDLLLGHDRTARRPLRMGVAGLHHGPAGRRQRPGGAGHRDGLTAALADHEAPGDPTAHRRGYPPQPGRTSVLQSVLHRV